LYKFVKPASAKRLHSASQHRMHKVSLLTCAIWTSFAVVTVLKSGRPRLRGGVCPSQVVPSTRQPSFNRRRWSPRSVFQLGPNHLRPGHPFGRLFVVLKGRVLLCARSENQKHAVLDIFTGRDIVGKGSIAGEPVHTASASALTDSVLLQIQKKTMMRALAREVSLSNLFWLMGCEGTCSASRTWSISAAISARKDWRAFFSCSPILTGRLPRTPSFQTSIMRPRQRGWALRGRGFAFS
jgi:hypothetical protein